MENNGARPSGGSISWAFASMTYTEDNGAAASSASVSCMPSVACAVTVNLTKENGATESRVSVSPLRSSSRDYHHHVNPRGVSHQSCSPRGDGRGRRRRARRGALLGGHPAAFITDTFTIEALIDGLAALDEQASECTHTLTEGSIHMPNSEASITVVLTITALVNGVRCASVRLLACTKPNTPRSALQAPRPA